MLLSISPKHNTFSNAREVCFYPLRSIDKLATFAHPLSGAPDGTERRAPAPGQGHRGQRPKLVTDRFLARLATCDLMYSKSKQHHHPPPFRVLLSEEEGRLVGAASYYPGAVDAGGLLLFSRKAEHFVWSVEIWSLLMR